MKRSSRIGRAAQASGFIATALLCASAGAETPAGTGIANTATLTATSGGVTGQRPSNTVSLIVAERLDLTLASADGPVAIDDAAKGTPFTLRNTGNGVEPFVLSGTAGAGPVTFAIDVDGDGRYDPAHDTLLADGRTPAIAAGGQLALLAVATGPVAATDRLVIVARAATASGQPGTVAPGAGDGGGDAVVGPTGATARIDRPFATAAVGAPTLVKTQAVAAPDGSARPVSGAVVTYTLEARFPAAAQTARIDDAVPAGTRYLPGTLRLDGAVLTDAAGDDAGDADGRTVGVTLGPVPAAGVHRVTFQVTLP